MAVCDVCGKNSLLPEKLGNINICKICFMKINGPVWKYFKYDKYEDVEGWRRRTIEQAKRMEFPNNVLEGIKVFFDEQQKTMNSCDVCSEVVQTLHIVGAAKLCKKCFHKISTSEWKEEDYETNEDVEKNRQKVLAIARKNFFPNSVIEGINQHFDGKLQKGLFRIKNGYQGQILKVYETYCLLVTENNFDVDEMSKQYGTALRKNQSLLPNGAGEALVRGFLSGGVIKAGMSFATSAAVSAVGNTIIPSKASFRVEKGALTIQYKDFDRLEIQEASDSIIGFLRFRNSAFQNNSSEDLVFFYSSNSNMKEVYSYIQEKMNEARNNVVSIETKQSTQQMSVADEILKFKNLLDIGAITQEEFDAKKKELLGL